MDLENNITQIPVTARPLESKVLMWVMFLLSFEGPHAHPGAPQHVNHSSMLADGSPPGLLFHPVLLKPRRLTYGSLGHRITVSLGKQEKMHSSALHKKANVPWEAGTAFYLRKLFKITIFMCLNQDFTGTTCHRHVSNCTWYMKPVVWF